MDGMGYVVRMIHGAETSLRICLDFARSQLTETGDLLYFQLGNSREFPGSCQQQLTNGNRKQISPTGNGDVLLFFL